jgi:hypothetical protein
VIAWLRHKFAYDEGTKQAYLDKKHANVTSNFDTCCITLACDRIDALRKEHFWPGRNLRPRPPEGTDEIILRRPEGGEGKTGGALKVLQNLNNRDDPKQNSYLLFNIIIQTTRIVCITPDRTSVLFQFF